jgi:glycosyltransferase involved in cell wall biosynthesis
MRRHLLWVTPIAPAFAAGGGGEIRQAHLIAALAERFDVSLLVAGRLTDPELRGRLRVISEAPVQPVPEARTKLQRRRRDLRWQILDRDADEVARQRPVRRALTSALSSLPDPDLVCIEYLGLAPMLPRRRTVPWALTLHNLPSEMARHNAAVAPGHRQRTMLALEERNARRLQNWAVANYDLVVAVSGDDAARLPGDVAVVPNGVDIDRFEVAPLPREPRVVFTGALHTLPNRDGIAWFCREVWPHIQHHRPEATLEIVGSRPPADLQAAVDRPGITVHADVPRVEPYLERARVAVVPLRIGSGSRLKALEAMAAGRPVIGTAIGLGGLRFDAGHHALVADSPESFADAVLRCLDDESLATKLAHAGRALVEARYAWSAIGQGYCDTLEDEIARFRTPS